MAEVWMESSSDANQTDHSFHTKSLDKSMRKKNMFFFSMNHRFQFVGSFDKRSQKKQANLDLTSVSHADQLYDASSKLLYLLRMKSSEGEQERESKIDYGAGIRVKRLKDGMILDWHEGMDCDSSFEDSFTGKENQNESQVKLFRNNRERKRRNSVKTHKTNFSSANKKDGTKGKRVMADNDLDLEEDELDSTIKQIKLMRNKKKLNKIFESKKMTSSLKWLLISVVVAYTSMIIWIIIGTLSDFQRVDDLIAFTTIDNSVSYRSADIMNIESLLNSICLMNNGTDISANAFPKPKTKTQPSPTSVINDLKEEIRGSLTSFEIFNQDFLESLAGITLADKLNSELNNNNIEVTRSARTEKFSLNEAIRQLVTTVMSILEIAPLQITFENPDVKWILENSRGGLMTGLLAYSQYVDSIKDQIVQAQKTHSLNSGRFLIVPFTIVIPLFYLTAFYFYRSRESFIETFYGFEQHKIKKLAERYESYLQYIQMHQIEEGHPQLSNSENSEEGEEILGERGIIFRRNNSVGMEDFINHLRTKKKKGSLVPWVGMFQMVTLLPLLIAMAIRSYLHFATSTPSWV